MEGKKSALLSAPLVNICRAPSVDSSSRQFRLRARHIRARRFPSRFAREPNISESIAKQE